jgi:hypothetical protein
MNVDESDNLGRDQFASCITVKFEAAKKRARLEAEAQKSWLAVVGYNRVRSENPDYCGISASQNLILEGYRDERAN